MTEETKHTADYLFRITDASFKMEMDRYESLTKLSTRLLTTVSILCVAVLSAISIIASPLAKNGLSIPLVALSVLILFCTFVALAFTLLSSKRTMYSALDSPGAIDNALKEHIEKKGYFKSEYEAARTYAAGHERVQTTIKERNDRILKWVNWALLAIGITLVLIIIACIILISACAGKGMFG